MGQANAVGPTSIEGSLFSSCRMPQLPVQCLLSACDTGWLYDISNSYNNSFYMAGICLVVSGLMLYPIPCIQRRRLMQDSEETQLGAETNQQQQQV